MESWNSALWTKVVQLLFRTFQQHVTKMICSIYFTQQAVYELCIRNLEKRMVSNNRHYFYPSHTRSILMVRCCCFIGLLIYASSNDADLAARTMDGTTVNEMRLAVYVLKAN